MEKIILLQQNVTDFLEDLILILFEKEYFGFEENAQLYVKNIYDFIEFELVHFPYKTTPKEINTFGANYAFYKANSRTTWYIFFEKSDNRYLVTYITNNHSEIIQYL